jgi:NADPH:quinone reductase
MKALYLTAPEKLEIVDIPMPKPKKGEVLVKMAFSPINPSDLAFLTGNYGLKKPYPVVPGLEGSGIVVENGGGIYGKMLLNKKVACVASPKYDGTWAEYMVTDAAKCIGLKKNVPPEQGSMFFVNPLTALAFIEMAKKQDFKAIVMSAAGSALAKMVLHLAQKANIPFIGLVRKAFQVADLQAIGAKNAINISEPDYETQIKEATKQFGKVLYLDCVAGGDGPYKILNCLPDNSKMLIYGRLEQELPAEMQPQDLLFYHYSIEGFWLSKKATELNFLQTLNNTRKVNQMLSDGFETKIANKFGLEDFEKAILGYYNDMSAGKVLFGLEL